MSSVFLSHNSKDKPWVRRLAQRLTVDGVVVWLDEAEINIGDSLIEKISTAIDQMKFVAAVISTNSIGSIWVQKELSLAMSKEIKGRHVTVLPLLIEHCDLPISLRDKLYADFTNPEQFEIEYKRLLRVIGAVEKALPVTVTETHVTSMSVSTQKANAEEIRIVGIVKEKTRQDRKFAGMQDFFLQLSAWPQPGWEQQFLNARKFPRHSMWRDAWLDGDCIVIKCVIDELSRFHLKDLKEDVATANNNLIKANIATEQARQHEIESVEKERKTRDDTLDSLKFD